jgi:hypothetical protein
MAVDTMAGTASPSLVLSLHPTLAAREAHLPPTLHTPGPNVALVLVLQPPTSLGQAVLGRLDAIADVAPISLTPSRPPDTDLRPSPILVPRSLVHVPHHVLPPSPSPPSPSPFSLSLSLFSAPFRSTRTHARSRPRSPPRPRPPISPPCTRDALLLGGPVTPMRSEDSPARPRPRAARRPSRRSSRRRTTRRPRISLSRLPPSRLPPSTPTRRPTRPARSSRPSRRRRPCRPRPP